MVERPQVMELGTQVYIEPLYFICLDSDEREFSSWYSVLILFDLFLF